MRPKISPKSIALGRLALLLAVFFCFLSSGCAGLSSSDAANFQNATNSAYTGLSTQLTNISSVVDQVELNRVLQRQPPLTLTTGDFTPVIDASTQSALLDQLNVLRQYANLLRELADGESGGQFSTAVSGFEQQAGKTIGTVDGLSKPGAGGAVATSSQAQDIKTDLQLFSGISSTVGDFAIDAYASHRALQIVKNNAAVVSAYCKGLQEIIEPTPQYPLGADGKPDTSQPPSNAGTGLVAITQVQYESLCSEVKLEFVDPNRIPQAGASSADKTSYANMQQTLATQFRDLLRAEDQNIAALRSLKIAIGKLGTAHAALANQDKATFLSDINAIEGYVQLATSTLGTKN
jgi:hypothetical protein